MVRRCKTSPEVDSADCVGETVESQSTFTRYVIAGSGRSQSGHGIQYNDRLPPLCRSLEMPDYTSTATSMLDMHWSSEVVPTLETRTLVESGWD